MAHTQMMGIFLVALLGWTSQIHGGEKEDVRVIYERHVEMAMHRAEKADRQVPKILKLLDNRGRFTDLNYGYKEYNKGSQLSPHLRRMRSLAQAWARPNGKYTGKRDIRDKAFLAFKGWLEADPKDRNWWFRTIGWPNQAWQAPMIMRDELRKSNPELLKSWVEYLLVSSKARKNLSTGANGTDIQKITLAAGALAGDYSVMKSAVSKSREEFKCVRGRGDGVYSDGSFAQHNGRGRQLYFGGYGQVYINGFFADCTSGQRHVIGSH